MDSVLNNVIDLTKEYKENSNDKRRPNTLNLPSSSTMANPVEQNTSSPDSGVTVNGESNGAGNSNNNNNNNGHCSNEENRSNSAPLPPKPAPICRPIRRPNAAELLAANCNGHASGSGGGNLVACANGGGGGPNYAFDSAWDTMSNQFQLCERHLEEKEGFCRDCVEEICEICIQEYHKSHNMGPGYTARKLFDETERLLRYLEEDQAVLMGQKRYLNCRRAIAKQDIQSYTFELMQALQHREVELLKQVDMIYECRMRIMDEKLRDMRYVCIKGEKLGGTLRELRYQNKLDALFRQTRFLRKILDDMRALHYGLMKREDEDLEFVPPEENLAAVMMKMGAVKHHSQVAVDSFNGVGGGGSFGLTNMRNGFDWDHNNGGGNAMPDPCFGAMAAVCNNDNGGGSSFDGLSGLIGQMVSTAMTSTNTMAAATATTATMGNNSYRGGNMTTTAAAAFNQQHQQQQQQQPPTPTLNQIMNLSLRLAHHQQLNATTPDSFNLSMLPFIGQRPATTPCQEPSVALTPTSTAIMQQQSSVFQPPPLALAATLPSPRMDVAVLGDNSVVVSGNGDGSDHHQQDGFSMGYHTSRNYNRIRKPMVVFGQEGSGDLDLCRPWGVYCDRRGHVLVADRSNNRITIFTSDGTHIRHFGRPGSGEGELNRPAGVAVDPWGRVIVTDKDNHRVQVFTMEGKFLFMFGEKGGRLGQFHYPWDVDVNERGIVAITDTRNHRVQFFRPTKDLHYEFFTKFGYETASHMWRYFDAPRGCCFTREGTLIVTDFNNHRLNEIAIDERRLAPPEMPHQPKIIKSDRYKKCDLFRPQGVTVDMEGNILVADCRNNRIQVFNREAELIGSFGSLGKDLGQFDRPSGIATTPDGKIAIVDFGNHRVQIF